MIVRRGITTPLLCGVLLAGCALFSRSDTTPEQPAYHALAARQFADTTGVEYLSNPSQTFMLVRRQPKPTARMPVPATSYFVYDLARQRVVAQERGFRGTVAWASAYEIEVRRVPGTIRQPQTPGEAVPPVSSRIDVRTGEPAGAVRQSP